MIPRIHSESAMTDNSQNKWFNSPVNYCRGTLSTIREHIPSFERHGFGLAQPESGQICLNERLDTITRRPFGNDMAFIPVGVVSKEYALVQHTEVLDAAVNALNAAGIALADVKAELKVTEYGERMALSLFLPDRYAFDPGDGHPMTLRLECINSVDGSTRFRALMGWFRVICSNGLIIGVTRADMCRRHVGDFQLQDIGHVLESGLKESVAEKTNLEKWSKTPISLRQIAPWIEGALVSTWGFKAATRVFHIIRTGSDVEIAGQYKDNTPTTIAVHMTQMVPGAPNESLNLYDVSQVLAWLAKERRDLQEQLEWREQIPSLMASLN